jgi:hypothetical protein
VIMIIFKQKIFSIIVFTLFISVSCYAQNQPSLQITKAMSFDSLGACQGISLINGFYYAYGDRECGVIRKYRNGKDSLEYLPQEIKLTVNDSDVINHPTGIAHKKGLPTFIGNSIRLNKEGTLWRAVIYNVNWNGLLTTGKLDNNLINIIEDDACIQGTRPEYVEYNNKWFVASADYGNKNNEVRLYDPIKLATATKTSETGVLVAKFTCSPWVQNIHFVKEKNILVLIQNQIEGRLWRFTFLDFKASIKDGHEKVIKVIDVDRNDELEGFTLTANQNKAIAVSSSRKDNVNLLEISW